MKDALQHALDVLSGFLAENPLVGAWYTTVVRFVFPLLALMILVGAIRSLWKVKHPDEVWGYLTLGNGVRLPLTHWGKHHRPRRGLRCAARISVGLAPARRAHP